MAISDDDDVSSWPLDIRLAYLAQEQRHRGHVEKPMIDDASSKRGDDICSISETGDSQDGDCESEDTGSSNSGYGVEATVDHAQSVGASSREIAPVDPKGVHSPSLLWWHGA